LRRENTYLVGTSKSLAAFEPAPVAPSERITRTVQFSNSDADDLIASAKEAVPDVSITLIKPGADTTTSAGAGGATTTTVREKGGILMVTGPAESVKRAQEFVALAENTFHPSVDDSETTVYRLKYMFGPNLISILHNLVPKLTVITGPAQEYESGAKLSFTSGGANSSLSLTDRYTGASAMAAGSKDVGPSDKTDAKLTSPTMLILTGTHDDITRALDVLSKVDVKPSQIMYEAKVIEIDDNDEKQLGVNCDISGALASLAGVGNATKFTFGSLASNSSSFTPGSSNLLETSVNALITNGRSKLLANPNISAIDGQRATVFIGDTINYVQSITQTTTGENVTTASVPVGVLLGLSGRVSDDGFITVYLHPEVDSVTQWTSVPGGGELPQLSTRLADTIIRVKSGDTIAIGGLTEDDFTYSTNKVPILGDLPILSNIFNNVTRNKTRENVMFLIKTSIVPDHA
jgi:type II secretory pathway component GspD/PulD (secretin)